MRKAGGIIALIAGIFGIIAAVVTLFIGGIGGAFGASGHSMVIGLGWGGILFSFLVIVFGAIIIGSISKIYPILLIISSVLGMILGGTIVAIFMILSFIGGLIAVFSKEGDKKSNE